MRNNKSCQPSAQCPHYYLPSAMPPQLNSLAIRSRARRHFSTCGTESENTVACQRLVEANTQGDQLTIREATWTWIWLLCILVRHWQPWCMTAGTQQPHVSTVQSGCVQIGVGLLKLCTCWEARVMQAESSLSNLMALLASTWDARDS